MVIRAWSHSYLFRGLVALAATLMFLAIRVGIARAAQTEAPGDQLQVWNLNTHGMDKVGIPAPCGATDLRTDYRQFNAYITNSAAVPYFPDIVTLQETGNHCGPSQPDPTGTHASCHQFEADLEARTGVNYYCVEAPSNRYGGAAIVYNSDRLSRYNDGVEVQLRIINQSTGNCDLSNYYAYAVKLRDEPRNPTKYINVESVHLSNRNLDGTSDPGIDCSWNNMKITAPAVTGLAGPTASMKIMAGDWNHRDAVASNDNNTFGAWECWYKAVEAELPGCLGDQWGFRDAMYRACLAATDAETYSCLHTNHWSIKGSTTARYDYLFPIAYARHNQVTVPWETAYKAAGSPAGAPKQYSDHRGQGALLDPY